jgi:hypothetical protein
MTQVEIERDYWRRLSLYLAQSAVILRNTIANIELCDEVQKDADTSLDEISIARLLEERGLKLLDKAKDLALDIAEFRLRNTKPADQNSVSVDTKFFDQLQAVSEESEQYNSSIDKLQKMVLERCEI